MKKCKNPVSGASAATACFLVMAALLYLCLSSRVIYAADSPALEFSDDGIAESVSGSGYSISGTTLTVSSSGTYYVSGDCSEGNIEVAKNTSGVILVFDSLTLSSSETAPVVVKKGASATIRLSGTSALTDAESLENEDSDDFEGAAIKVKSGSQLTITGDGSLNVNASKCKNGIKGASEASITINSGTISVTAANNGVASDGELIINGGSLTVTAEGDGIKSEPESDDTASSGAVTINGGVIKVYAQGDGIQAANKLTITDGDIYIQTLDGYDSTNFDSDTMSCKGLKASTNEQEDVESELEITGGTFYLNTADDALHSDAYITITGGTFEIYTGDDGAHADTSLILGSENGSDRDPDIAVYSSYEGLEGGTVYILSGRYYITASDDGINAAGGSSDGSDPGQGGDNNFKILICTRDFLRSLFARQP